MKYYTVIVVKIDAFESQIINERHFGNYEDAEEFSAYSLNTTPKTFKSEEVTLYGVKSDSKYTGLKRVAPAAGNTFSVCPQ